MSNTKRMPRWVFLPFLLVGAYVVAISLDLLPYVPNGRKRAVFDGPQHWQVTSIGLAFFFAGLAIFLGQRGRWLSVLIGAVLLLSFLAPMVWFVYFSGVLSVPMRFVASVPLVLGGVGGLVGLIRTAQGKS